MHGRLLRLQKYQKLSSMRRNSQTYLKLDKRLVDCC